MRPPVLLRQTVISVTPDRKTCRINSKSAPPIPKYPVSTCPLVMSADNDEFVQASVAPVQRKTKVVQIVLNAVYTTFYFEYQCVMHKSAECRQNAAKVCMVCAQVFLGVSVCTLISAP